MTPRNRAFRRSSWTSRHSTPSPASSPRASASASSSRRLPLPASPSRSCRSSSPRSSSSAADRSSSSSRTTPRPATLRRPRAGSSGRRTSASSPRAACAGGAGSSRRRTSSASAPAPSRSSRPAGSSAPRRSARQRACRRKETRPETIRLRVGDSPGSEELVERLALAGYERVEQAQERGQFAVRGGIVDVYPSTGREPVRLELFGDEIESLRAYSAFTQRTLHPLDQALIHPAVERRSDLVEPWLEDEPPPPPDDLVLPLPAPDLVWQADDARQAVQEELGVQLGLGGATELSQLPAGQRYAFEAQRPAVAARGLSEAERDLLAFVRGGNRVVVTFAHRGEALRTKALLRRIEPDGPRARRRAPGRRRALLRRRPRAARLRPARSRPRPPPGHADLPQAPAAGRRADRPRSAELRRPAHGRLRRPRGPRRREAPRLRDEDRRGGHARLSLPRLPR